MVWTCPKGHERRLDTGLAEIRELVAALALTSFCQSCQTSYLMSPETQHRVLQRLEERALRDWVKSVEIHRGAVRWTVSLVQLRLVARFPPDTADVEVIADAGPRTPRVRLAGRVPVDTMRSSELMKQKIATWLEQRIGSRV